MRKREKRIKDKSMKSFIWEEVKSTYKREDGSLNGLAIFISVLALVLVLMLGRFVVEEVRDMFVAKRVSAAELSLEDLQKQVEDSFYQALEDEANTGLDTEPLKERLIKLLARELNASGKFTDSQIKELMNTIEKYLDEKNIYSDMEARDQAIKDIYQLISDKYTQNREMALGIKTELTKLLEDNKGRDSERYDDLKLMIDRLDAWLLADQENTRIDLAKLESDLRASISTLDQDLDALTARVETLEGQVCDPVDRDYKFQYGYLDGMAGYYVDGVFRPF
ncbi:MAG: hypothetical protein K5773_08720 [Pseudobutyrivibrio sp.]|nr:hypothetical protein [Pseudobutyrivibrio sp.]